MSGIINMLKKSIVSLKDCGGGGGGAEKIKVTNETSWKSDVNYPELTVVDEKQREMSLEVVHHRVI